ncbi:molybdate ABC transporter substrate-binding protein [Mycolicibacterium thermoresistibile]|uniref:Molybdate-binding lipoprotein ModA n=2 Tax=Mycolicibacterium thermoresistibile TaxID=1797 RepID=G7CLY7_MYCT3|nr:molybdate ABC transporter substrate-binding protein [Mycolicibacterium thermoresistibile]EHI10940.1 molybdate-binding lipoprotein ModA [Mycolicibacterium thermoresistibile ATCC 19527]MCV7188296.1 molybdate ABC transporter substrate-binding protein [Mycolicibacterium thermoresistibile]GAT13377.1 molybdate ABC transporter molybdate-binding protein [Mycolicibacterium thermoresistibile]SNW18448.1 molybdate-binding lipoprotein ModA [Mycolicibacterium thermoresistibile]
MIRVRRWLSVCLALMLPAVAGCGTGRTGGSTAVTVYAAASLQQAFTTLGELFEAEHPDVTVRFTFAGSADLATQLLGGADADVFAAADEATMERVAAAGLLSGPPVIFAANTLTVVTAPGNPHGLTGFADLARAGPAVVTCAPQVPCGAATQRLEQLTGVDLAPVSEENSVSDVLHKVTVGQADAGVVYRTDARRAGDTVHTVEVPAAAAVPNRYPVAVPADAARPDLGQRFIDLITGAAGRDVLAQNGFSEPR